MVTRTSIGLENIKFFYLSRYKIVITTFSIFLCRDAMLTAFSHFLIFLTILQH